MNLGMENIQLYFFKKCRLFLKRYMVFLSLAIFMIASFQNCTLPKIKSNALASFIDNSSSQDTKPSVDDPQNMISHSLPDWNHILRASCNAEGLLWNNTLQAPNSDPSAIKTLVSSPYFRIARAVETWTTTPDISQVQNALQNFYQAFRSQANSNKKFIFGAFIAEAINYENQKFYTTDSSGNTILESGNSLNVLNWCLPNTIDNWGNHTCAPDISNPDYQNHILVLTQKLMDIGITDFQFGELGIVDPISEDLNIETIGEIGPLLIKIRAYAKQKGINIIIGGQPNTLATPVYLSQLDYIVGPSHFDSNGNFITSPVRAIFTDSYDGQSPSVWYSSFKNYTHILVEADWSSDHDDIHYFASLPALKRRQVAFDIYTTMVNNNMGWTFPYSGVPYGGSLGNGPCLGSVQKIGPRAFFYTYSAAISSYIDAASNALGTSCADAQSWSDIMLGTSGLTLSAPFGTPATISVSSVPGFELLQFQNIQTKNLKLIQQVDGGLVLYQIDTTKPLWSSGTGGRPCEASKNCGAFKTVFQADGNFVVYEGNTALWATFPNGLPLNTCTGQSLCHFSIQEKSPYLTILNSSNNVLWSSASTEFHY
jgi:hypothetical protein